MKFVDFHQEMDDSIRETCQHQLAHANRFLTKYHKKIKGKRRYPNRLDFANAVLQCSNKYKRLPSQVKVSLVTPTNQTLKILIPKQDVDKILSCRKFEEDFLRSYIKFIYKLAFKANQIWPNSMSLDDYCSEGYIAARRAFAFYDGSNKFITFLGCLVRSHFRRLNRKPKNAVNVISINNYENQTYDAVSMDLAEKFELVYKNEEDGLAIQDRPIFQDLDINFILEKIELNEIERITLQCFLEGPTGNLDCARAAKITKKSRQWHHKMLMQIFEKIRENYKIAA